LPLLGLPAAETNQLMALGLGGHVALSVLAVATFTIAAAQALLLLFQHKQLKRGHIEGALASFPPMQTMEVLLFELLCATFFTLIAAIIIFILYVDDFFC